MPWARHDQPRARIGRPGPRSTTARRFRLPLGGVRRHRRAAPRRPGHRGCGRHPDRTPEAAASGATSPHGQARPRAHSRTPCARSPFPSPAGLKPVRRCADPRTPPGEVRIRVVRAINRADASWHGTASSAPTRRLAHPPSEVSGVVDASQAGVTAVVGRRSGLRCGSAAATPRTSSRPPRSAYPSPWGVSVTDAAALPEVALVWSNVFMTAKLTAGEVLLSTAGRPASARWPSNSAGKPALASRSPRAAAPSWTYAVTWAPRSSIDYRTEDFVERVRAATNGHGSRQYGREISRPVISTPSLDGRA